MIDRFEEGKHRDFQDFPFFFSKTALFSLLVYSPLKSSRYMFNVKKKSIIIHKLVVKLHVIRTKENNDRYFERYFATRVIMDIILPPW